jgi:hypothetical protein
VKAFKSTSRHAKCASNCSAEAFRCGTTIPVAVPFTIEKGWHIQAETPEDMSAIGAGFSLKSRQFGRLAYPVFGKPEYLERARSGRRAAGS